MLFSPGHPAEIVMRSGFIDLGTAAGDGRPKVISSPLLGRRYPT